MSLLSPGPGETVLDCTVGLGGHAEALAAHIGSTGVLVINDVDQGNLQRAVSRLEALPGSPRVVSLHGNFAEAPRKLMELGLAADVVLADLGFASNQMDDPSRGFSFRREGPLDMRLGQAVGRTAADLVNALSEQELSELIRDFGEERRHRQVARKLVEARKTAPIETTAQLADLVRSVVRRSPHGAGIDPATRTFQALRIAVNDEIACLESLLESVRRAVSGREAGGGGPSWLNPGARVGVISFHSLEDRPVKKLFSELVDRGLASTLARKPVEADDVEVNANPRARSAKLRAIRVN